MRKLYYFFFNIWLTLRFLTLGKLAYLFIKDPIKLRKRCNRFTTASARGYLKSLRISVELENPEALKLLEDKNYLVVANHVSYADIIVLSSLREFVFITSEEMGKTPFLGAITRYGGSLYTDRKKFVSLPKEIERFSQTARDGFRIVLFPEGTSTDGSKIREFRSSLFEIARQADLDILPICINYVKIDNQPRSEANRDLICWYGDMDFLPHFMKLLGHSITARVKVLEPIAGGTRMKRQDIANAAYDALVKEYTT